MNKKELNKLKEGFKNDEDFYEHFGIDGIILEDDCIKISGYGKLHKEELEKFCLFIAKIDESCFGEVVCSGEDSDDFWRIDVCGGWVEIKEGSIEYNKDGKKHELYIEYFGYSGKEYYQRRKEKIRLYRKKGLTLISLEPMDLEDLEGTKKETQTLLEICHWIAL